LIAFGFVDTSLNGCDLVIYLLIKVASQSKLCFTAMEQPNAITAAHVGRENMSCFPASCFSFIARELSLKCLLCHLPTSHVPTPVPVHVNADEE
jgi:hypothetical protein